jgi:hypothetical protein
VISKNQQGEPYYERWGRVVLRAASTPGLGRREYQVLIAIAGHADKNGHAYPSMTRIASRAGLDRSKVPSAIAKLEAAGLVRKRPHTSEHGDPNSNLYELVVMPEEAPGVPRGGNTVLPQEEAPGLARGGNLTDQVTDKRTDPSLSRVRAEGGAAIDEFEKFQPKPEVLTLAGERGIDAPGCLRLLEEKHPSASGPTGWLQ